MIPAIKSQRHVELEIEVTGTKRIIPEFREGALRAGCISKVDL